MVTQKILIKCSKILLSILAILCIGGCITYLGTDGPYEGKVVDAETGQPIEGAVVHGLWYKAHSGPGGATHTVYSSHEMLTDANGEFKMPGQGLQFLSNVEPVSITILKARYSQVYGYIWGLSDTRGVELKKANMAIFKLKRLTIEERKSRSIELPVMLSTDKFKLLMKEESRENSEIGKPVNPIYFLEK